jgi:hypothetical protein
LGRFSGYTIGIDLAQFLSWHILTLGNASFLLLLFTAIKLHLHDPTSSPARVQGMAGVAIGWLLVSVLLFFGVWGVQPSIHIHRPFELLFLC